VGSLFLFSAVQARQDRRVLIGREENLTVLSLQSPIVLIRQSEKGMLDLTSLSLVTEKGIPAFYAIAVL